MRGLNKDEIVQSMVIDPPKKEELSYILSRQSANTLFNYMKRLEFLKLSVKNKAMIPRYNEEFIEYLDIGYRKIAFPQTCFCDINLQRVVSHTELYGEYGIAFYKPWCIENGIQPIHYINEKSSMCKDFTIAFNAAISSDSEDLAFQNTKNQLLTHLFFMKPIIGIMKVDGQEGKYNFHDEKEWRYVPALNSTENELPQVVLEESANIAALTTLNETLRDIEEFWLKFEYENVKYLIVRDTNDQEELIKYIVSDEVSGSKEEKLKLISKIMVLEEIKKDW